MISIDGINSFSIIFLQKAEDIYTAAGWESLHQNGYLHGSPSRFSAKSAIYTVAGCQHIIAIYTAAVSEQVQTIYTAAGCQHIIAIYTTAVPEQIQTIYTAAGCQHIIAIYTAANPEQIQTKCTAAVSPHTIAIYTAAIQEPNRLYTLLLGVYKNRFLHGRRSRAKSAIYIAFGCIHKTAIYTAAIQEPNRLYTCT